MKKLLKYSSCRFHCLVAVLLIFAAAPVGGRDASVAGDIVVGYVENAWIANSKIPFEAKMDTGAQSASINAANSEYFQRDGKDWVRFELTNRHGISHRFEVPIKTTVRVRRAGTTKQRRFVIELPVCVGGHTAVTELSLADRSGLSYQVLVGRKFLSDKLLVSSAVKFKASGRCRVDASSPK